MAHFADVDLTTLAAVKAQLLGVTPPINPGDDAVIQRLIGAATDFMTQECARSFIPVRETRAVDARGLHVDGACLNVGADLLEIVTLTNGDGTVITSGQYALLPRTGYPKYGIELLPSSNLIWTDDGVDWQGAITLDGLWGYHEDYAHAWVNTLDSVQDTGGINATTPTITVTDADGQDARYQTRFAVGQLLKVESEFLKVLAVVADATNQLTVLRGANGTTAATHAKDKPLYSYAPMRNLEQICIALVAWLYRNKGSAGDQIQVLMEGTRIVSGEVPRLIMDVLEDYLRR